jgi:hypothetical protein
MLYFIEGTAYSVAVDSDTQTNIIRLQPFFLQLLHDNKCSNRTISIAELFTGTYSSSLRIAAM